MNTIVERPCRSKGVLFSSGRPSAEEQIPANKRRYALSLNKEQGIFVRALRLLMSRVAIISSCTT